MINRAALMRIIKKTTRLSYRDASACVEVLVDTICDGISRGERIELRGLGSFTVRQVAAKRHPNVFSETKTVPAHGRIVFRPCQKLRESVWNRAPV
jgi:nucleoid DNA-binding protein